MKRKKYEARSERSVAARFKAGEQNRNARMTAEKVRQMRARYERGGISQLDLAFEFGISQTTCGKILRRESWKDA